MIGCLILGTFVAVGAARLIHRHHGCAGGFGGPGCGGFRHRWRARHGFHHRGDPWGGWGPADYEGGAGPRHPFAHEHGGPPPSNDDGDEGGWGGPFGYDGTARTRGRGFMNHVVGYVLGQVRATATQERVIRTAFEEFREEMKEVGGGERKKTRQDISAALRKPQFDEVFMGELFARQDNAIERTRKAFVGLMARVHDALDEEQRGRLAELVEKGPRFWRRGFDW
jgi:Spy/CpxP family protein refolding chaperone